MHKQKNIAWVRRLGKHGVWCGVCVLAWLCLTGCPPEGLRGGVFYKYGGKMRYRIGELSGRWRLIEITENDLAYYNNEYKATVQINSTCRKDYEDVSLNTLTDHIFYGLRERKLLRQSKRLLDNRAALYTEMAAKLDGVLVQLAVIVMKKNECIFDFSYIVVPHNFGRGLGDFYRLIHGFKVLS